MGTRLLSAVAGVAFVAVAFPVARYLAAEAWSPGAVGFWLLVAVPGLALLAHAARVLNPLWLAPVLPMAVALLGLDVTDSSRSGVVTAGYLLAVVGFVAALATAAVVQRRRPTPA